MNKTRTQFKDTMYDYANINEYYSFYGSVIYISSDYLLGNSYFLILRNKNQYAFVTVEKETLEYFSSLKNRDDLVEDLENIEPSISFVSGFTNFVTTLNYALNNSALNQVSRSELIKLKNNPEALWNHIQVENIVVLHRKNKTVPLNSLLQDSHQMSPTVIRAQTQVANIYGTQLTLAFDWIVGNPFVDMSVIRFSGKVDRRLYLYDIKELSDLIKTIALNNEENSMKAAFEFCQ